MSLEGVWNKPPQNTLISPTDCFELKSLEKQQMQDGHSDLQWSPWGEQTYLSTVPGTCLTSLAVFALFQCSSYSPDKESSQLSANIGLHMGPEAHRCWEPWSGLQHGVQWVASGESTAFIGEEKVS